MIVLKVEHFFRLFPVTIHSPPTMQLATVIPDEIERYSYKEMKILSLEVVKGIYCVNNREGISKRCMSYIFIL